MSEIKIPKRIGNKSQFLFKNKLTNNRKSRKKLLIESFYMIALSLLIVFINSLIPNKLILFTSFYSKLINIFDLSINLLLLSFDILLVLFIILTSIFASILLIGGIFRIIRILCKKHKKYYSS